MLLYVEAANFGRGRKWSNSTGAAALSATVNWEKLHRLKARHVRRLRA